MTATQLSVQSKETLNKLYRAGLLQTYGQTETSLDIEVGTWLSELFALASSNVSAALAGDLELEKEINHRIFVGDSTTTNANGANLTIEPGAKNGSGTDGILTLGQANTSAVRIATSAVLTTIQGTLQVDEAAALNGAVTLGNASTDLVTFTGAIFGSPLFQKEANHTLAVAASTTTNANGGNLTLRAGAKDGSGTNGILTLGDANTSAIAVGASGVITTFSGPIAASADAWTIADPGASGAIPVTRSGVCNITTAAGETRTLAAPSFVGQKISLCMNVDGGDAVITVASAINQTGNNTITMNDAGDYISLEAVRIASALRWRVFGPNDGCTLTTV